MYVDSNELRIQRECLCSGFKKKKKGHLPSSSRYPPRSPALLVSVHASAPPLFAPRQPFACPPVTHRCNDHTVRSHRPHHSDCHLRLPSVEDQRRGRVPLRFRLRPPPASSVPDSHSVVVFYDVGYGGGFNNFTRVLLHVLFFSFEDERGGM